MVYFKGARRDILGPEIKEAIKGPLLGKLISGYTRKSGKEIAPYRQGGLIKSAKKTATSAVGGISNKGSMLNKLLTSNAKDNNSEKNRRKKGLTLGPKAAVATIASFLMLKQIRNNLEKSSGYLGAVMAILGKVFLMALMPIATLLGAIMMPTVLKLLDIFKGVLDRLKGPIGDLIGGKIDPGQFIDILLPELKRAFILSGKVLAEAFKNFADLIWPIIQPKIEAAWELLKTYLIANIPIWVNNLGEWLISNWKTTIPILMLLIVGAFLLFTGPLGIALAGIIVLLTTIFTAAFLNILNKTNEAGEKFGIWLNNTFIKIANKIASLPIPQMIKDAVSRALSLAKGAITSRITTDVSKKDRVKGAVNPLKNISNIIKDFGSIMGFANGGIVTKPTLAMIGEAGPEAIIPLGKSGGIGSNYSFNINIDNPTINSDIDIDQMATQISDKIYEDIRRKTTW